jgi:hypothetical protein
MYLYDSCADTWHEIEFFYKSSEIILAQIPKDDNLTKETPNQ